jgi:adenosylcobinamide-GDP ribazoletransferase
MLAAEMASAIGALTVSRGVGASAAREHRIAALAFYPVVGLVLGALGAAVATATGSGAPGVLVLAVLAGPRPWYAVAAAARALVTPGDATTRLGVLREAPAGSGWMAAAGLLAVKLWAGATLPGPARAAGLLIAPMLGAWAMVVQCYGGTGAHARGPARDLIGRARFREFGWASLVAIGATLALGDGVGLLVVLASALVIVVFRVVAHRRLGGLTGRLLFASRELVETVVLVTLAGLARLLSLG